MKGYSRRELFKTFGPSALLLYPILSERQASAAAAAKKRFFALTSCAGVIQSAFWPQGNAANYTLAGTSLEPLAALTPNLTIVQGLLHDFGAGDSHSAGQVSLLTGNVLDTSSSTDGRTDVLPGKKFAFNASIDQLYAASIKDQTPINSLVLAVQPTFDRPSKYVSYNADGTYVQQSTNPYTVFNAIFKPLVANCVASGQTLMQTVANLQARRKSILDAVLGDLADASRLSGLGAAEKAKLDAYTEAVNQIEKTLATTPISATSLACTSLSPFTSQPVIEVTNANYAKLSRLMMDLVIAAFQLDVTRVATLVWEVGGAGGVPSIWANYNGGPIPEGHHDLTHQADPTYWQQKCAVLDSYHAAEFSYFLSQLRASPEGGGTILDNSLALWSSELGNGAAHDGISIPFILGGSAAGALKTGRYLQVPGTTNHQKALIGITQALGLPATSIGRSGNITSVI